MNTFDEVAHTADLSFRVRASNLRELFVNTATALIELQAPVICENNQVCNPCVISAEGIDEESLLINWLNNLLYLQDTQKIVPANIDINNLSSSSLTASILPKRFTRLNRIVKAVTFHNVKIESIDGELQVTIVVDV